MVNSLQDNKFQPINISDPQNKFFCASLDDVRGCAIQSLEAVRVWTLHFICLANKTSLRQVARVPKFYWNDDHKNYCLGYFLLHYCFIPKHSMQVGKIFMTDNLLIHSPFHDIKARTIEPTDVIKEFNLCYRLACVIKHLTRTKHKAASLKGLQKAAKHLNREIKRHQNGMAPCVPSFGKKPIFTIPEILEDWRLAPNLEKALFHILHSCQVSSSCLERELFFGKGNLRLPFRSKDFFYHTLPLIKAMRFLNLEISELQNAEQERRAHS